jgi:hypothetical protein
MPTFKLIFLSLCFSCYFSVAQSVSDKNIFFINKTWYYHFNKDPLNNIKYINNYKDKFIFLFMNEVGFMYQRRIDTNEYWRVSLDVYYFRSPPLIPFTDYKRGQVFERNYLCLNTNYLRDIYFKPKQNLKLVTGLNFRFGDEALLSSYGYVWFVSSNGQLMKFGEPYFDNNLLADLGLSLGLNHQFYFGKRLVFNTEFKYTFYAFLYGRIKPKTKNHLRSNRNNLSLSFSLGWRYGVRKGKKKN